MLPPTTAAVLSRQLVRSTTAAGLRPSQLLALNMVARRGYATPMGPPPKNFRPKTPPEWDQEKEGTFDKVGKYFLLSEMARGMYVLLEQFFRAP